MPVVNGEFLVLGSALLMLAALLFRIPPLVITSIAFFSYYVAQLIFYHLKIQRLMNSGLKIERRMSGIAGKNMVFTNQRVKISLTIENLTSYNYKYFEIEDCLPQNWEVVGENKTVCSLGPKSKADFSYLAIAKSSGSQIMPGLYISLLDESHLFFKSFFYPLRTQFNVFISPEQIPLRALQLSGNNSGATPGPHIFRQKGMGSEFREIREYIPGDSFKKIAWSISARKNKLMSRELESDISIRSNLFLDISPSMKEGTVHQTKLDFALKIAANFANLVVTSGDPIGIYTFDSQVRSFLTPNNSRTQLYKILNILSEGGQFEIAMTEDVFKLYYSLFEQHLEQLSPYLPNKPKDKVKFIQRYLTEYFQLSPSQANKLNQKSGFRTTLGKYLQELDIISETTAPVFCPKCQSTTPFHTPVCPKCGSALDESGYDKTEAICAALCRALSGTKGKEIFILISDLENIKDLNKLIRTLGLVATRNHKMVIISPSTLSFRAAGKYDVKKRFTKDFLSKTSENTVKKIRETGLIVHHLGPEDSVNVLLSNIIRLKQLQGVM